LTGQYYLVANGVLVLDSGELEIVAVPLAGDYPLLRMRFLPEGSAGEIIEVPHPGRD
jgi:hypothetical protein